MGYAKDCSECGKSFMALKPNCGTCSGQCRTRAWRKRLALVKWELEKRALAAAKILEERRQAEGAPVKADKRASRKPAKAVKGPVSIQKPKRTKKG